MHETFLFILLVNLKLAAVADRRSLQKYGDSVKFTVHNHKLYFIFWYKVNIAVYLNYSFIQLSLKYADKNQ